MIEALGFFAAFCTTIAFVPQAVKVYKTKQTKDISMGMFLLLVTGIACWSIYGILLGAWPIIIANTITFVFALYIFIMKLKYT